MYNILLHLHNIFRWLILIAGFTSTARAYIGWTQNRPWTKRDNLWGLLFSIFLDLQFLIGIILYVFLSPLIKSAYHNFGAAMKNPDLRFFAVEHVVVMIVAIVFIHIGRSRSKKAATASGQHKTIAVYFTIGLLLILAAIPWGRSLL